MRCDLLVGLGAAAGRSTARSPRTAARPSRCRTGRPHDVAARRGSRRPCPRRTSRRSRWCRRRSPPGSAARLLLQSGAGVVELVGHAALLVERDAHRLAPRVAGSARRTRASRSSVIGWPVVAPPSLARRREPAAAGLLQVHLEDVDVRQPRVALDPQPVLALAADGQRAGRAVGVEQDRAVAVGPDVVQRGLAHLVVGDRHADERVGVAARTRRRGAGSGS